MCSSSDIRTGLAASDGLAPPKRTKRYLFFTVKKGELLTVSGRTVEALYICSRDLPRKFGDCAVTGIVDNATAMLAYQRFEEFGA
jgi:hypothetical protein